MPLLVAMFGFRQQRGQLKQSLILVRLPLSGNTSQLEAWERPMRIEVHKEAQKRRKCQRTILQWTISKIMLKNITFRKSRICLSIKHLISLTNKNIEHNDIMHSQQQAKTKSPLSCRKSKQFNQDITIKAI